MSDRTTFTVTTTSRRSILVGGAGVVAGLAVLAVAGLLPGSGPAGVRKRAGLPS